MGGRSELVERKRPFPAFPPFLFDGVYGAEMAGKDEGVWGRFPAPHDLRLGGNYFHFFGGGRKRADHLFVAFRACIALVSGFAPIFVVLISLGGLRMSDGISWFRLYHSFLDNDKTGPLSLADRGAWVTLAILASRNSHRGKIPPLAILKRYMGKSYAVNPSRIRHLLERFYRLTLLDKRDGEYYLHNFASRQWIKEPEGVSRVDNGENQQLVNSWSTNCCNDLLIPGYENKRDMGKRCTEKAATDTDTEYIGGLQNAFMLFNAHIAAIRLRSGSSHQAFVDSPIGKQSPDNVLPFPASNRPQAASTCAHVEHTDTRTGANAPEAPCIAPERRGDGDRKGSRAQSPSDSPDSQGGIVHGSAGDGARGSRTSKARGESQKSLPGVGRSSFDAAFGETWALWQSLPGITHHKRFVDSDRQAFKRTWALLGGDAQALADIQTAIKRYSAWSVGAKAGRYRPAYRWTFCEFIRHRRGSLIQRLASDSWELTCEPFTKAASRPDRSVASLLASASRLAEGGA